MSYSITTMADGRVIRNDFDSKIITEEYVKPRRLPDGSLIFPHRGDPPKGVRGYIVDPGDKFHFLVKLPCPHQYIEKRILPCKKIVEVTMCAYLQKVINEDTFLTCEKCLPEANVS